MARRKCTVCGSKRWHKEPASGLVACSEGHVLQARRGARVRRPRALSAPRRTTGTRRSSATSSGRTPRASARSARSAARGRSRPGTTRTVRAPLLARRRCPPLLARPRLYARANAPISVYRGARGRALYFACLQLLVRAQAAALAARWALPPAFEAACRDVWALHLRLLDGAAPPLPDADLDADGDARAGPAVKEEEGKGKEAAGGDGEDDGDSNSGSDDGGSHASDPDMHSLMDELEASASSSDDENADRRAVRANTRPATRGRRRRHSAAETPAAGLAVIVLACWTLRVPVTYPDFIRCARHSLRCGRVDGRHRLIESYELPYLEPVRRGPLPASMVTHLTKYTVQALSPPVRTHGSASVLSICSQPPASSRRQRAPCTR
jgi:RNA polymerase I-specific transcription initiation factor RRN7